MEAVAENIKVPEYRFPGFSTPWRNGVLSDFTGLKSGGTPSKSDEELWSGNIPWISASEMHVSTITHSQYNITEEALSKCGVAEKGDVLMLTRGSMLWKRIPICICATRLGFNQDVKRLRPKADRNWFYFALQAKETRLLYLVTGTGIGAGKLDSDELKQLNLPAPEIQEQQKIAEFLSAVDEKIAKLKRKKELLEEYKKGMMQKLFSQEIRFKDEDGNDFPDWEFWRLGALTAKTGKRNKAGLDLPVYSINNKVGFNPQADEFEGLDSVERGYDTTAYKVISRNTFAYNPARVNVGSLGYSGDLQNVIISSLYVCFQTHELIDDQFLWQYFRGGEFRKEVVRKSEGGVRLYLFYENFSGIPLMLPSLTEQKKIADVLNKSDDLIASLNSQIAKAAEFKRGLLQKMFV